VVSEGHVGVNPKKIRDVTEWPTPISMKEVRGFLGLYSYYRRFVKDFSKIAAPLSALSEKNRKFCWTGECQRAFETLKTLLTTAPVLAMPNDVDTFILDTDASQYAIGAVLSQIQKGIERPVAYACRKLSKSEVNYYVFEVVSIDVTGPHPRSRQGNVYMLTVMNHFSKWSDAFPIPNHSAATVARVLFNRVFVYFGTPVRLLSDQRPEFESKL